MWKYHERFGIVKLYDLILNLKYSLSQMTQKYTDFILIKMLPLDILLSLFRTALVRPTFRKTSEEVTNNQLWSEHSGYFFSLARRICWHIINSDASQTRQAVTISPKWSQIKTFFFLNFWHFLHMILLNWLWKFECNLLYSRI